MDIYSKSENKIPVSGTLVMSQVLGMCGGVRRALSRIDALLDAGEQVAVLHEPVHNRYVTAGLQKRGVIFAGSVEEVPPGAVLVIGAHGAAPEIAAGAERRGVRIDDTTCPLVKKLQQAAAAVLPEEELVFFGKADHPEAVGVLGHAGTAKIYVIGGAGEVAELPELRRPVLLVQTTSGVASAAAVEAALRQRFPALKSFENVCAASRERQQAVLDMAEKVEAVIIVGSPESANANRLREVAERAGAAGWLIGSADELPVAELLKYRVVGLSAGASTPDILINETAKKLESLGFRR